MTVAVTIRTNTPIEPNTSPVILALLRPGWLVRQKPAGAVVMQEELKGGGVPLKRSFTSGNVHEDGYLFMLQEHSPRTGFW